MPASFKLETTVNPSLRRLFYTPSTIMISAEQTVNVCIVYNKLYIRRLHPAVTVRNRESTSSRIIRDENIKAHLNGRTTGREAQKKTTRREERAGKEDILRVLER
jgi:hypothetical protein